MIDVKHIAKLANLPLAPDEEKEFQEQLADMLDYISELQGINTKNISPTSQVTGKTSEFRDDVVVPSLSQEEALKNGRKIHKGFFVTKIVWE